MDDCRFQILSLDGGGYKGMFSAAVLARLEEDLGISICDHFDLIAGTSTGGIIALGLGAGLRPIEIVEFYARHGAAIFPSRGRWRLRRLLRAKYRADALKQAFEEVFDDKLLADSNVPLVIPSYDLGSDDVYLFRTPHIERLRRDWKERMVDVALATTAAPTYLPAHRLRGLRLVDGGVWANNPSLVALVEAVSAFEQPLSSVRAFSLGTTSDTQKRSAKLDHGGLVPWAPAAIKVALRGQSLGAKNAVFHMLPEGHLLRCDPAVPEGLLRLDGVTTDALMGRAEHESRIISDVFKRTFVDHQRRQYMPLHYHKKESE